MSAKRKGHADGSGVSSAATSTGRPSMDDLAAVVEPGETVPYTNLIQRLKYVGRPTNGLGVLLEAIRFRGHSGEWRGAEVVSFRTPYFDREAEGDWTDGTLYVIRRELEDDQDA